MYYFINNNIRVRICESKTFFVNIKNNVIYNINTDAYLYLKKKLDENLTVEELINCKTEFRNFIDNLIEVGVIEKNYED